mmetsp:Transcript_10185/g.13817  ORF Transcript_10185/g.13817 Transcript_10185/m.13817 type:complete len:252 (-) Transcript_10185:385-1140(-)|eukprot:CAMPEP_0185576388 /NCGR_PEP_ID=MMETSP0434-20130131/7328_1 /TAXON_ID=626734 ORGANISM="Favella taraikaensis, Strain Fe Narragansett Bay" /NCGR_SAMPLE_ID=MMETSP0434 /ASSEMBLY_ACC=CAM_ASM_000379 /LENGTH=251 /DNA_ID=CAMNT_0028193571 /DNA_START=1095 /DNA_END=1850 /DNA_ORIENTATION=-
MAELTWMPVEHLRIVAAFASGLLFFKVYDWLRLFEGTAFFVQLILATAHDIRWFLLLLLVALLIFGLPMSMLSLNRDKEQALVNENFFWWGFDLIYNQYLLSLGEFESLDAFPKGRETQLVMLIFVVATLFTQITMLNMLIAIMGNTYDNFMEYQDVNSIRMKLQILSEQAPILAQVSSKVEQNVYMVVVRPSESEAFESDTWQGTVNELSKIVNKQSLSLEKKFNKKIEQQFKKLAERNTKADAKIDRVE